MSEESGRPTDDPVSHVWSPVARRSSTVSFAVRLVDAFTGGPPLGRPVVTVDGVDDDPIVTPRGFVVFVDADLPAEISVHVDAGPSYRDVEAETIAVRAARAEDPPRYSERVVLEPTPQYPFPAGTTLFRGTVTRGDPADERWVAGARVWVGDIDDLEDEDDLHPSTYRTVTNDRGEFVLCPERHPDYGVERVDGRWRVRIDGADPVVRVDEEGVAGELHPARTAFAGETTPFHLPTN